MQLTDCSGAQVYPLCSRGRFTWVGLISPQIPLSAHCLTNHRGFTEKQISFFFSLRARELANDVFLGYRTSCLAFDETENSKGRDGQPCITKMPCRHVTDKKNPETTHFYTEPALFIFFFCACVCGDVPEEKSSCLLFQASDASQRYRWITLLNKTLSRCAEKPTSFFQCAENETGTPIENGYCEVECHVRSKK